ncbi:ead/Ea22-like family protein [Enterobacter asburiae]|uniref:ead/Ea22-like family protein n=1 Tax=Enterobacter asburiae TaxID=61645 RepID=UPI003D6F4580
MSNIDKQALNQEKIEWLNKLADMEYCKSNPGHWLMSLKDTNMLAKLALRSVALLDELEAAEKKAVEMPTFDGYVPHVARELQAAFRIACDNAGINVTAAGKGEAS